MINFSNSPLNSTLPNITIRNPLIQKLLCIRFLVKVKQHHNSIFLLRTDKNYQYFMCEISTGKKNPKSRYVA